MAVATVRDGLLNAEGADALPVGGAAWFAWLERADGFSYVGPGGRFTARREPRARGGRYWRAYRKVGGRLRRAYLGRSEELTAERLVLAASQLADGGDGGVAPDGTTPTGRPRGAAAFLFSDIVAGAGLWERRPPDPPPLMTTRLAPPPAHGVIPRQRLLDALDRAVEHQLTLVVAPPGFGKTTLLAAWARRRPPGAPAAWLTCDEGDGDPVRFWSYLAAALDRQRPGVGAAAAELLHAPQPAPAESIVALLVNALAESPGTLTLVLDDFHAVESAAVHTALATLVAYAPLNFRLVVASRVEPPLPLSRLRAHGGVAEVRAEELRCTAEEGADLLRRLLGRDLAPSDVNTLVERTEGWVAGLQLAALSLTGEPDVDGLLRAARGENRYIWDYLVDEVLNRQAPDMRAFLLATAPLDRMCAELCESVLAGLGWPGAGERPAHEMLAAIERASLFLVPLDGERRWFRYHRLFADVLRLRARQLSPELVGEVQRRAAAWYRGCGMPAEAVALALAAGEWAAAAEAAEEGAEPLLMRGEVETLLGWARALPPEPLRARPRLCLYYAGALVVVSQLDEAEAALRAAELPGPRAGASAHPGEIETLRGLVAAARDEFERAIPLATTALELLSPERELWRLAATMCLSTAHWMRGELTELSALTERQVALSAATGNDLLGTAAAMQLAYIQIMQCRLHEAARICRAEIEPDSRRASFTPFLGYSTLWLSEIAYEWNDLEAAARFARDGIAHAQRLGNAEQQALNCAALAVALQTAGDSVGALAAADQAERLVRAAAQPSDRALISRAQVRLWLARGDTARALALAERELAAAGEGLRGTYVEMLHRMSAARAWVAAGGARAARAAEELPPLIRQAEARGQVALAVEGSALLALALADIGEGRAARAPLAHALALTQTEGHLRLYADFGEPMRRLLADHRAALAAGLHDPAVLAYVDRVLAAFAGAPTPPPPERLSPRELAVLRLVAAGRSNHDVACTLVVAESTVKMHLKNIFGKLGAHSRTEAAALARERGLL